MSQRSRINISTEKEDITQIEVDSNESLENVKALIEVETAIPVAQQVLFFEGKQLPANSDLLKCGVKDNDLIFVKINASTSNAPQSDILSNATAFQNYVRSNPTILQQLLHSNPQLAEAVLSDDITLLQSILSKQQEEKRKAEEEQQRRIALLNADPFNMEAQRLIEEEIRMGNINENMEQAIEHIPESFARVVMLYVDCQANGIPVKAFVDSGAQQTIMSAACAERCGIMRLVDQRYSGIAKGVGTARIIGRVHLAQIKLGKSFFPCSFTILEDQSMDFLLGLDMLRRHQCSIDLKDNVLRIGDESVPFLSEKDIPKNLFSDSGETPNTTTTSSTNPNNPGVVQVPPVGAQQRQQQQQPQQTSNAASFPETSISQLTSLGFSREEAIGALRMYNGNVEAAGSHLFGGGF